MIEDDLTALHLLPSPSMIAKSGVRFAASPRIQIYAEDELRLLSKRVVAREVTSWRTPQQ
jgi:hypothetical protein